MMSLALDKYWADPKKHNTKCMSDCNGKYQLIRYQEDDKWRKLTYMCEKCGDALDYTCCDYDES